MATLQSIIHELERLFQVFNTTFFEGELLQPVITVQANSHRTLALGWCTTQKIWRNENKDEFYYEINLTPEFFRLGIHEICGTLLHEMAHLADLQLGIKDCSRGGTYHNLKFKVMAERFGLDVGYSKKYGWTVTSLTQETMSFIDALMIDPNVFALYRHSNFSMVKGDDKEKGAEVSEPIGGKGGWRQYICPQCGTKIRASKNVNIICGDCNEAMTIKTK